MRATGPRPLPHSAPRRSVTCSCRQSSNDERDHMLFCEQVPEIGIAWRLGRVGVRLGESVAEQGVELAHKRHVGGAEAAKFERAKGHAFRVAQFAPSGASSAVCSIMLRS